MTLDSPVHRACWERLPWLANETLAPRERADVEAHLASCEACREELALQRRIRASIRTDEAVVLAPQAGFQKLMQRMDEARQPERIAPPTGAARWPRWVAVAAGVQTVAIGILLAMQLSAPAFDTLSSSTASSPSGRGARAVRIVFADSATLGDTQSILRSIGAQIIDGPSEAGVYTLTLKDGVSLDAALVRLRADRRVVFAESILERAP